MASHRFIKRLQSLIWVYIYGGLLAIVLAMFVRPADPATAWQTAVIGGFFVVLGVVLIYARSRLREDDSD